MGRYTPQDGALVGARPLARALLGSSCWLFVWVLPMLPLPEHGPSEGQDGLKLGRLRPKMCIATFGHHINAAWPPCAHMVIFCSDLMFDSTPPGQAKLLGQCKALLMFWSSITPATLRSDAGTTFYLRPWLIRVRGICKP